MKLKALFAGLALLWAQPASADNFVLSDALGNFVTIACTVAAGVCTIATTNGSPTVDQEVDLVEVGGVPIAIGQGLMAASLPVAISSNQSEIPVGGSGTAGTADASVVTVQGIASMTPVQVSQATAANLNATVQPGNTPNTTAWLVQNTPSSASAAAVANVVSTAVETGRVIKSGAGNLYGWSVTSGAVAGRVLIHNTTAVPSSGAVTPVDCAILPANSTISMAYPMPLRLGTGISISFSTATTCFTQTDSATAFISGQAS